MDFACDADDDSLLAIAEQEKSYLDQAFFVLMFGALERQINLLAMARTATDHRRAAMREASFEKRLDAAIKVANEVRSGVGTTDMIVSRAQILDWYEVRSDIAHGDSPSGFLDIVALLHRAKTILNLLGEVEAALEAQ